VPDLPLRGYATLTVRDRSVRFRKLWLFAGPVLYLIASAVVGTYLANRKSR
jgi:hypothetical protein